MVQEDQIHSQLNFFLEFVMKNSKMLLGILGAFVVVVIAIYFLVDYRSNSQQELQAALGQAIEKFQSPVGDSSADDSGAVSTKKYKSETEKFNDALSAFSSLAAKAKGTSLYPIIAYHEGLCQQELGKKSEFIATMDQLIRTSDNAEIASLAQLALAENYLYTDGDVAKATEYYEAILKDPKASLPKDEILVSLAEYHSAKNEKGKATEFWKRLLKEFPTSKSKNRAESELTKLGEKIS